MTQTMSVVGYSKHRIRNEGGTIVKSNECRGLHVPVTGPIRLDFSTRMHELLNLGITKTIHNGELVNILI